MLLINPCCCDTCSPVFSDDFERADSGDPGSDWTETAGGGDCEIKDGKLRISGANVICRTASDGGALDYQTKVWEGTVRADTAGDKGRFGFYNTVGTVLYALEIEFGASATARMIKYTGGVTTVVHQCACDAPIDTDIPVRFIQTSQYDGSAFDMKGWVNDEAVVSVGDYDTSTPKAPGGYAALGSGDTCAGNIDFDNVSLKPNAFDDTNCPPRGYGCWPVEDAELDEITLVIAGITNSGGGTQSNLNGTYTLAAETPDTGASQQWAITGLSINMGTGTTITELRIRAGGATNFNCPVESETIPSIATVWRKTRDSSSPTVGCAGASLVLTTTSGGAYAGSTWTLSYTPP